MGWFAAPVIGWLLVAGERGATSEELIRAVGDSQEVTDALAILRSHGFLEVDGNGPGNLATGRGSGGLCPGGEGGQRDSWRLPGSLEEHGEVFRLRVQAVIALGREKVSIFCTPNLNSLKSLSLKRGSILNGTYRKMKKIKIQKDPVTQNSQEPGKLLAKFQNSLYKNSPNLSENKTGRSKVIIDHGIEIKSEMEEFSTVEPQHCEESRVIATGPVPGVKSFRSMIEADSARIYGGSVSRYIDNPSEYPILNVWRSKENPNHWKVLDWVGYWLHRWLKNYGQEDPLFVGQRCNKPGGNPDIYLEYGFQAIKLRDSDRGFRGDGVGLKEYLDWIFDDFLPDSSWIKTPIHIKQVFRIRDNMFLDRFKVRSVKVRSNSPKPRGKWNPWGYSEG